jgi:hypothetical protein
MAGTFPPDYFSPDYFAPDYFGGETDANAISATIAGVATVTADLTAASSSVTATITGLATVAGTLTDGAAVVVPIKPPGGDDAPRSHVGIPPKLVKDKKRRKDIKRDELEELYNRILGLVPDEPTKAQARVVANVQKAIAPGAIELPPASEVDFAAIEAKAARALREAYERLLEDDDEAVIAYLLAA